MKFKSCPFCGSNLLSVEYLFSAWGEEVKEAHVVCDECAASSPIYIWDCRSKEVAKGKLREEVEQAS